MKTILVTEDDLEMIFKEWKRRSQNIDCDDSPTVNVDDPDYAKSCAVHLIKLHDEVLK